MFENTLDKYAHSNRLRNTNSYFKVLFAILTMVMSLISTSPVIPLIIALFIFYLIIFKAKISWKFYLKFLLVVPVAFGILTFIYMALFFGVGPHVLELGFFNLSVTSDGFNLGLLVFSRMLGGFSCLAFLALTTPVNELFSVLENFKIPKIVLEIAMLMYRYIFVFLNESLNMYHAQETRLGYTSFKKTYTSLGMLVSNLFIKTWVKGEHAYLAMESRCYDGSIKLLKNKESIRHIGKKNMFLLVLFETFLFIGTFITGTLKVF